jgi:hypothetical protein
VVLDRVISPQSGWPVAHNRRGASAEMSALKAQALRGPT